MFSLSSLCGCLRLLLVLINGAALLFCGRKSVVMVSSDRTKLSTAAVSVEVTTICVQQQLGPSPRCRKKVRAHVSWTEPCSQLPLEWGRNRAWEWAFRGLNWGFAGEGGGVGVEESFLRSSTVLYGFFAYVSTNDWTWIPFAKAHLGYTYQEQSFIQLEIRARLEPVALLLSLTLWPRCRIASSITCSLVLKKLFHIAKFSN